MADRAFPPIFDGHNDTLLSLDRGERSFFERSDQGHIDLPRARVGGLGGGFFACFTPSRQEQIPTGTSIDQAASSVVQRYSDPATMPPTPDQPFAEAYTMRLAARLFRLERESNGEMKVVRTADELRRCLEDGTFAAILHVEGAEAIDTDFNALEVFYQAGLRSLGIVWSRPNTYAHGVPFQAGASPDTGPGLTDAGRDLVRACNRLGVMLDLSHLNERGFWDVAGLTDAPLVATHSNAWALAPTTRNLTDKQLDAVKESRGMVGLNFHVHFLTGKLTPDGKADPETPLSVMADQIDYLVQRCGIDCVGFGSDFDGATMPRELRDAAGLPKLMALLRERGYDDAALRQLAWENWVRVLRATWKSA